MPDFAQIITHGSLSSALILDRRFRRVANDLDEADFSVLTDSPSSYNRGDVIEGWRVRDVDTVQEGSGAYEHRLSCRGIIGSKATKLVSGGIPTISLEGWDTAEVEYITAWSNLIQVGSSLTGFGNMICIEASSEKIDPDLNLYRARGSYKGIAGAKAVKRVVSVNGNVVTGDSIRVPLTGGWGDYRKAAVLMPTITAEFLFFQSGNRAYTMPVQGGSAPGPLPSVTSIAISGDGLTWNWPNQWRRISVNDEQIPGTSLNMCREVWEYQPLVSF